MDEKIIKEVTNKFTTILQISQFMKETLLKLKDFTSELTSITSNSMNSVYARFSNLIENQNLKAISYIQLCKISITFSENFNKINQVINQISSLPIEILDSIPSLLETTSEVQIKINDEIDQLKFMKSRVAELNKKYEELENIKKQLEKAQNEKENDLKDSKRKYFLSLMEAKDEIIKEIQTKMNLLIEKIESKNESINQSIQGINLKNESIKSGYQYILEQNITLFHIIIHKIAGFFLYDFSDNSFLINQNYEVDTLKQNSEFEIELNEIFNLIRHYSTIFTHLRESKKGKKINEEELINKINIFLKKSTEINLGIIFIETQIKSMINECSNKLKIVINFLDKFFKELSEKPPDFLNFSEFGFLRKFILSLLSNIIDFFKGWNNMIINDLLNNYDARFNNYTSLYKNTIKENVEILTNIKGKIMSLIALNDSENSYLVNTPMRSKSNPKSSKLFGSEKNISKLLDKEKENEILKANLKKEISKIAYQYFDYDENEQRNKKEILYDKLLSIAEIFQNTVKNFQILLVPYNQKIHNALDKLKEMNIMDIFKKINILNTFNDKDSKSNIDSSEDNIDEKGSNKNKYIEKSDQIFDFKIPLIKKIIWKRKNPKKRRAALKFS